MSILVNRADGAQVAHDAFFARETTSQVEEDVKAIVVGFADLVQDRLNAGDRFEDAANEAVAILEIEVGSVSMKAAYQVLQGFWLHRDALKRWHDEAEEMVRLFGEPVVSVVALVKASTGQVQH